jgi:hypothetical protein
MQHIYNIIMKKNVLYPAHKTLFARLSGEKSGVRKMNKHHQNLFHGAATIVRMGAINKHNSSDQ